MSEYKCENHKLNIACLGCITAIMRREKKLLEFVKHTAIFIDSQNPHHTCIAAEKLLKEIGEL